MKTEASLACIESVKILSVKSAPPLDPIPVNLHYFENETYKNVVVKNMRSTYFDDVVISTVFETSPPYRHPLAGFNSARNVARTVRAIAKRTRASMAGAVAYSEPVLDLRSFVPNNISHLLLDIIPFALMARDTVGPGMILLTQPVREPFLELLGVFGLTPDCEDRRVTGPMVKMSGTRGLAVYDLFGTFDCNGIHFAPNVYALDDFSSVPGSGQGSAPECDRIFLARRAPRSLLNQEEFESVTSKHGYKTIFMEDYSVREQLSLGAQARHVVALHGAAMGVLMMSKGFDSMIEILPPNVYHQIFPVCLGRRVRSYHQIVPNHDPRVAHCGWEAIQRFKNGAFAVNAPLLDRLLSEIHA